jgi:peptidoglycan/LPS O-acetylase OafA/YrhL
VNTSNATPHHRFRADVEGLRAIAVVAVVLYHARVRFVTGGYVGVDVFFVISGFLITGLLLRDDERSPLARIGHFYARRIRRIVPAATLVILVTLLGAVILQTPLVQRSTRVDATSAMFFFSNIRFARLATDYFHQGEAPSLFQHFWSLSIEEQFYLVWPALLVGTSVVARGHQRRAIAAVFAVVGIASFVVSVRLTSINPSYAFFLLPARAWELCAGGALALAAPHISFGRRVTAALRIAGLALIAAAIFVLDDRTRFPGFAALLPVLGTAAVICAGTPTGAASSRALTTTPMQLGGRYSYSLYLWHWPVLRLFALWRPAVLTTWQQSLAVIVVVAVPAAVASYHVVEHPLRTTLGARRDGHSFVTGGALATAFAVALVPYNALGVGALDAHRTAPRFAVPVAEHATDFVPSNLRPPLAHAKHLGDAGDLVRCAAPGVCVAGDTDSQHTIVLYGDSHADHWALTFAELGERHGWHVRLLGQPGCRSFVEPQDPRVTVDCAAFRALASARIAALHPDLVVFSNHSPAYFLHNQQAWARGVGEALDALPAGVHAAVISETPDAPAPVPECLSEHLHDVRPCEPPRDKATLDPLNRALRAVVTAHGGAFLDLTPWFCTATRCPVIMGNVLVYRDANHLTVDYTEARADAMADLLRPLLRAGAAVAGQ